MRYFFTILILILGALPVEFSAAQEKSKASKRATQSTIYNAASLINSRTDCENGDAGGFPCQGVDLLSFLSVEDLRGGFDVSSSETNDIWGWTDPVSGSEYALVGMTGGTSFVDVTDADNPEVIGFLPTHTFESVWRDIKVYENHAFIVADGALDHGIQIFDLNQLRGVATPPVLFQETAHYDAFGSAHNIVINEETGYAYVVGARSSGTTCGGGLHMVDIRVPASPTFAGCFADTRTGSRRTGYTHDAQCVLYNGPDEEHRGKEICFGSNETALSIADVSDKSNPVSLSFASYPNVAYSHQGWLTEDHRFFYMNDELDESRFPSTRTLIWDVQDLDDPILADEFFGNAAAIDHNLYVNGSYMYQANYTSGIRILNIQDPLNPVETGFFDVYEDDPRDLFSGTWSSYPFFESGVLITTSIYQGLFVLDPGKALNTSVEGGRVANEGSFIEPAFPNPFQEESVLRLQLDESQQVSVRVYDILGREVALLFEGIVAAGVTQPVVFRRADLPGGKYFVHARGERFWDIQIVTVVR